MSDDEPQSSSGPGWLERLGQAISGEPRDREDLIEILTQAAHRGILDVDTLGMLIGVLAVGQQQVRDIMIPRAQMVVLEREARLEDILPIVIESGHSRFPVIAENRDEVIGLVMAKDLLRHIGQNGNSEFQLMDFLREAVRIPESKRLDVLLREFRTSRNHMAIVVDEYGGVAGLVTIEDVLEQIVGEIDDEFDVEEETPIIEHGKDRYSVSALLPIEDFNARFGTDFSDEEFDTVGGLVVNHIGHLPRPGERVTIGAWTFRVVRADRRRVHLLEVVPEAPNEPAQSGSVSH